MRTIVFFDVHGEDKRYFKRTFKNVHGIKVVCTTEPLTPVTAKKYSQAVAVSVFLTSDVNQKVLETMSKLELIATRSTGYDHIDTVAAKRHHVLVSTVPRYGEKTVAEFTFMLLLALARRLPESREQVSERLIDHPAITGFDIDGKTIGIIGCGRIGRQVARMARGFGMDVLGYDPHPEEDEHITYVSLSELLSGSDVISLHAPATKATRYLINSDTIAQMKSGVTLLNTARGELIDTQALIDALFSGQIGAAGLDVLEGEQLLRFNEEVSLLHPDASTRDLLLNAEHNVLLRMPNVLITPHNAFNSQEALRRIRYTTAENIKRYLMHEPQNLIRQQEARSGDI